MRSCPPKEGAKGHSSQEEQPAYEMSPSSAGSRVLDAQGSPSSPVPERARAEGTGMPFRVRVPWHRPPGEPRRQTPCSSKGGD